MNILVPRYLLLSVYGESDSLKHSFRFCTDFKTLYSMAPTYLRSEGIHKAKRLETLVSTEPYFRAILSSSTLHLTVDPIHCLS